MLKELHNGIEKWGSENRHATFSLILFFVLANLVVKGWHIDYRDIWLDEAYSIFYSQESLTALLETLSYDSNPPLYNVFLKGWTALFGIDKIVVRIPSLVFNTVSAVFLFLIGKRYFNLQTAIIASVFFLLSHVHLQHAHNARSYAMSSMLCLISYYHFFRLFRDSNRNSAVYLCVLSWMLIMCHYSNFLVCTGQALISFLWLSSNKKSFRNYWIGQIAAAVLFLPWLYMFYTHGMQGGESTVFKLGALGNISFIPGILVGNELVWIALLVLLVPSTVYFYKRLQKGQSNEDSPLYFALIGWSLIPLLMAWAVSLVSDFFRPQYLMVLSFGFWLLIGYIITTVVTPTWAKTLLLVYFGIALVLGVRLTPDVAEDWTGINALVSTEKTAGTYVIVAPDYQVKPFVYDYKQEWIQLGNFDLLEAEMATENILAVKETEAERLAVTNVVCQQAEKVVLIQAGYRSFDLENQFPTLMSECFEMTKEEAFPHTRVLVFEKR